MGELIPVSKALESVWTVELTPLALAAQCVLRAIMIVIPALPSTAGNAHVTRTPQPSKS